MRHVSLILALAVVALGLVGCCGATPPAAVIRFPLAFAPDAQPSALGYSQATVVQAPLVAQPQAAGCTPAGFTWAPAPAAAPVGQPCP